MGAGGYNRAMIHDEQSWSVSRRRWVGAAVAVVTLGTIVLLHGLTPAQGGMGTHRQMGISPCGMVMRTGYPCPGCGVTTSMTAMAHGQIVYAAQSQIFGVVAMVLLLALGLVGAAQAAGGRNFLKIVRIGLWKWYSLAGVVVLLVGWGLKVAIGVADGTYPIGR